MSIDNTSCILIVDYTLSANASHRSPSQIYIEAHVGFLLKI